MTCNAFLRKKEEERWREEMHLLIEYMRVPQDIDDSQVGRYIGPQTTHPLVYTSAYNAIIFLFNILRIKRRIAVC